MKYIWKNQTNAPTFNWVEIQVKAWDVFEVSKKNQQNLIRMYWMVFKKVSEDDLVKETKEVKKWIIVNWRLNRDYIIWKFIASKDFNLL